MNQCSLQGIFIDYSSATFNYHIYNPVKGKVQVVYSVNMDENNLFDHSQVSFKEFADEEWQEWDNNEFGNPFPDINDPLPNQMEEDSISFPCSIISLPTPSLTPPQTSSGSNRSNEENTASVRAPNFEDVDTQSEDARPDTESAQSLSGFVEEELGNLLANPLALPSTISTH